MSKEWYLVSKSPLYCQTDQSGDFDFYSSNGFTELLQSFVGKDIELYQNGNIEEFPIKMRMIVENKTADNQTNSEIRQFLCPIGVLKSGQYIKYDDMYFVIKSLPDNNGIYEKAIGVYCKYVLNFKSKKDGRILHYPISIVNATQHKTGETDKSNFTIGSSQHLIYIPYDSETIKIDNGQRFLIDKNKEKPTTYRVTQVDSSSYSYKNFGVLQWTVVEDTYSSIKDNKELMVADYYSDSPIYSIEVDNKSNPIDVTKDNSVQIVARVICNDGHDCSKNHLLFTINSTEIASVTSNGIVTGKSVGECVLHIVDSDSGASCDVNISVVESIPKDVYSIKIIADESSKTIIYGDSKIYKVRIYKNANEDDEHIFVPTLKNSDGVANLVTYDKNSVKIETIDSEKNIGKEFILDVRNEELNISDEITLKVGDMW